MSGIDHILQHRLAHAPADERHDHVARKVHQIEHVTNGMFYGERIVSSREMQPKEIAGGHWRLPNHRDRIYRSAATPQEYRDLVLDLALRGFIADEPQPFETEQGVVMRWPTAEN